MIRNDLIKYVIDVSPLSDRFFIVTSRGTVPITLVSAYLYTMTRTDFNTDM